MMDDKNLEQITRAVMQAVGQRLHGSGPDVMEVVVREVVSAMSGTTSVPPPSTPPPPGEAPHAGSRMAATPPAPGTAAGSGNRAVVTTTGPNKKGVLGIIATQIAEAGGDIQDVSQTIISDFFTMIMLVDIDGLDIPFSTFKEQLVATSERHGTHTVVIHEKVLLAMQRV